MAIRTELSLRLPNSPGALAGVCRLLSDERVNIVAMGLEASGQLRMVVDNHVHGGAVLREHHHQVTERDVILMAVPNSPGSLAPAISSRADSERTYNTETTELTEKNNRCSLCGLGVLCADRSALCAPCIDRLS